METVSSFGRAVFFMAAGIIAYLAQDSRWIFVVFFIVAAIASLGIMQERFKALNTE